jgi:hypothetical protein
MNASGGNPVPDAQSLRGIQRDGGNVRGKKAEVCHSKRLEIFLKAEVSRHTLCRRRRRRALCLLLCLLCARHDTSLLVVTDTLLEEVGLAGKRDVLHKVEGVCGVVVLGVAESQEQTVGNELNVLAHEGSVHAKQSTGKSIREELLLDSDSLSDDGLDGLLAGAVVEEGEQQASKVCVHALVTRDELVGEGETGHETALLQPEDGRERTTEEDALDGGEGNEAVGEGGVLVGDPTEGPVGLLADAGNCDALVAARKRLYMSNLLLSMALNRYVRCLGSLIYVSMRREYVSAWTFSIIIWKP